MIGFNHTIYTYFHWKIHFIYDCFSLSPAVAFLIERGREKYFFCSPSFYLLWSTTTFGKGTELTRLLFNIAYFCHNFLYFLISNAGLKIKLTRGNKIPYSIILFVTGNQFLILRISIKYSSLYSLVIIQ